MVPLQELWVLGLDRVSSYDFLKDLQVIIMKYRFTHWYRSMCLHNAIFILAEMRQMSRIRRSWQETGKSYDIVSHRDTPAKRARE